MTAAISRPSSTRRWRSPLSMASRRAGAQRKSRGKYRGIGISCMLEHAGGTPHRGRAGSPSPATARSPSISMCSRPVRATPRCSRGSLPTGSASGDEHATHKHGDSAREIAGYASVGSRSAMTAGAAIVKCVDVMLEKGKRRRGDAAGGVGSRHRLRSRKLRRGRYRPPHRAVRTCRARGGAEEARRHRGGSRHQGCDRNAADVSQRRPYRRGRNRSGHRPHGHRRLHRGRRLRQCARRHDRRGPARMARSRRGSARR